MIYAAKQLEGYRINARDGVLGTVKDLYFDDQSWNARYFVVATGSWLMGRQVLISAARLVADSAATHTLSIDATQDQVRNSPPTEMDPPVSRQQEQALHDHFGWPYYWGVVPLAGGAMGPMSTASAAPFIAGRTGPETDNGTPAPVEVEAEQPTQGDPHLRSAHEVRGYSLAARDGSIGHIEDFLLDDEAWEIRHLVVDTRNWLPGRKVLLSPRAIQSVNWATSEVQVNLDREQIKQSPEYDPRQPVTADYTDRLAAHYRFPRE